MVSTITSITKKTKELVLIGFAFSSEDVMKEFEYIFPECNFVNIFHQGQEKKWLKDRGNVYEQSKLPLAFICDYQYLIDNNYSLVTIIQANPTLKSIPFIVINDTKKEFNNVDGLRRGIDDCYLPPIDWKGMKKRIQFLQKHKSNLINAKSEENEMLEYKMPIGKRVFDVLFSIGVLTALSPLLLFVAVAIKLESKGDLVYRSKRAGSGYKVFDFLKFRSMFQGADAKIKELEHLNKYGSDDGKKGPSFVKLKNDPRITRVGKFIRKLSIDELPQFINVLKGDMSIVGNRPLPLYEAEQLTSDEWATRFIAPAGITGWWQINKQAAKNLPESERIKLDIEYAENYSIWFDIKIIMKTIPAMVQKDEG